MLTIIKYAQARIPMYAHQEVIGRVTLTDLIISMTDITVL